LKVIGNKQTDVKYNDRKAVRVIVVNPDQEMVILYASKDGYYKLPGGGVEADEDHQVAGEREVMEETGCKAAMDAECIATSEEWRNDLHQISYCYRARLLEETGKTQLMEDELADGLGSHRWMCVETALKKMKAGQPTSEVGRFIKERDLFFVEAYAKSLTT
jgi:8-oxo-dGTP diphosphatase